MDNGLIQTKLNAKRELKMVVLIQMRGEDGIY